MKKPKKEVNEFDEAEGEGEVEQPQAQFQSMEQPTRQQKVYTKEQLIE